MLSEKSLISCYEHVCMACLATCGSLNFTEWIVEGFGECLDTDDVVITVNDLPNVDAGSDRDRLYVFIGRPQPWDNENAAPDPVDSFQEFSDDFADMISMKRVLANDTIQVIRRIDWIPPEQTTGGVKTPGG